jgi:hypothetical protein
MYNKDILYPRNDSGYEAQINDNFEVVKMDNIVDLLDNGYTYSIKPLSKAVKDRICDERLLDVASSIDRHEQEIKRHTSLIADEEKDLAKDKALFAKLKAIHCK